MRWSPPMQIRIYYLTFWHCYFTAYRRSRLSTLNSSADSIDFNTTVEEMLLYDMFGEDYDEVSADD